MVLGCKNFETAICSLCNLFSCEKNDILDKVYKYNSHQPFDGKYYQLPDKNVEKKVGR